MNERFIPKLGRATWKTYARRGKSYVNEGKVFLEKQYTSSHLLIQLSDNFPRLNHPVLLQIWEHFFKIVILDFHFIMQIIACSWTLTHQFSIAYFKDSSIRCLSTLQRSQDQKAKNASLDKIKISKILTSIPQPRTIMPRPTTVYYDLCTHIVCHVVREQLQSLQKTHSLGDLATAF